MFSNYFSLCPPYHQPVDAYTACVITVQSPVVNVSRAPCKEGYTGEFCEQQTQLCGPNQPCHAHANCVPNKGAFT